MQIVSIDFILIDSYDDCLLFFSEKISAHDLLTGAARTLTDGRLLPLKITDRFRERIIKDIAGVIVFDESSSELVVKYLENGSVHPSLRRFIVSKYKKWVGLNYKGLDVDRDFGNLLQYIIPCST